MITFCGTGSALLSQDLKTGCSRRTFSVALCYETQYLFKCIINATLLQSKEQKKTYFFTFWISLDLWQRYRQTVTDIVAVSSLTETDSVTMWHIGFKAPTKCSFPLCQLTSTVHWLCLWVDSGRSHKTSSSDYSEDLCAHFLRYAKGTQFLK